MNVLASLFTETFRLLNKEMNLNDDATRTKLLADLMQDALEGPTSRISRLDPKLLAARELPPGNWQQLYILYVASCAASGTESASRSTFYCATKSWRKTLRFRHRSQHSTCGICDKLKSRLRACKDFQAHARCADDLLGHLTMTWRCRQVYWSARATSRARQDLLCIIYDGFDKSKPMLPRWSHGRLPKIPVFERIPRTHLAVSATLAHGWGCCVFLAEEGVSTGGSYSWEALFITISKCWEAARQRGISFPSSFPGQIHSKQQISNSVSTLDFDKLCFVYRLFVKSNPIEMLLFGQGCGYSMTTQ